MSPVFKILLLFSFLTMCRDIIVRVCPTNFIFFFFNDTATTEIYTLSLHDALPIFLCCSTRSKITSELAEGRQGGSHRSEEHTSELQSHSDLVCRLLLEKKKKYILKKK